MKNNCFKFVVFLNLALFNLDIEFICGIYEYFKLKN